MSGSIIGMLITGVFGLLFTLLGIYMALTGRGSHLIAGYNTMSKADKGKYDSKALSKFIGKTVLIPVGLSTVLFAVGLTFGATHSNLLMWITIIAYCLIVTGLSIFAVIYCNTGNRFRK